MTLSEKWIRSYYISVSLVLKNKGNTGYYIKFKNNDIKFIHKKSIFRILTAGTYNDRKKKLMYLKIMNE